MTAGHTGAGMATGVLQARPPPGVDRPGLAVQMITDRGPLVLINIGANPDSTAENLAQYARMGAIFARGSSASPSSGRAPQHRRGEGQGRCPIQRATELLDASTLRFVGNVEGRDLTRHLADVVVTDAVAGNVVIKFFEGLSAFIFDLWRTEFRRIVARRLAYLLMRPSIARIRQHLRLRDARWLAVARREGTVIITTAAPVGG